MPLIFPLFTIIRWNSFVQKLIFKWFYFLYQNVSLSACFKTMHIAWKVKDSRQCVQQWLLTQVLTGSELFFGFIAENCQKYVSSTFADSSKNFLSDSTKKLPGLCDGHWISWRCNSERFQVTLGREKVFSPRYSSDVEQFFSFCFALAMTYHDIHHQEKCCKSLSTIIIQPLLTTLRTLRMR